jgi:hypothetical protein
MRVGWAEISAGARTLAEKAGWTEEEWDPYAILKDLGISLGEDNLPSGERALYLPRSRVIVVRRGLKTAARLMATVHELGHAILPGAAHSDVHAFSLCAVYPPQQIDRVRFVEGQVTAQALYDGSTPQWAAVLRARWAP